MNSAIFLILCIGNTVVIAGHGKTLPDSKSSIVIQHEALKDPVDSKQRVGPDAQHKFSTSFLVMKAAHSANKKHRQQTKDPDKEPVELDDYVLITNVNGEPVAIDNPVAFTAELSMDTSVVSNQTIVNDRVILNEGGLYFGDVGLFVCPDDSVYIFFWTVKRSGMLINERATGKLVMGNVLVKHGPTSNYQGTDTNSGSGTSFMTTVARCVNATSVRVEADVSYSNEPYITYEKRHTSFSGFRLSPPYFAIAFTVETSADQYLFPNNRIMFDRILRNFGGHYISAHGYFDCPQVMFNFILLRLVRGYVLPRCN